MEIQTLKMMMMMLIMMIVKMIKLVKILIVVNLMIVIHKILGEDLNFRVNSMLIKTENNKIKIQVRMKSKKKRKKLLISTKIQVGFTSIKDVSFRLIKIFMFGCNKKIY